MKIKGLLWKEGVNGLGIGPGWIRRFLPYRKKFHIPALTHDRRYDIGGGSCDREKADREFLKDMISTSTNTCQKVMAHIYYHNVRAFGWLFFRYDA